MISYVENPEKTVPNEDMQHFFDLFSDVKIHKTNEGEYVSSINCLQATALQQMILTNKQYQKTLRDVTAALGGGVVRVELILILHYIHWRPRIRTPRFQQKKGRLTALASIWLRRVWIISPMNTGMKKIDYRLRRIYSKLYPKKYKSSHTHQNKILICYNYSVSSEWIKCLKYSLFNDS